MPEKVTKTHNQKRINDILLGPLERPALKWLAEHMPAWVTPDKLTLLGFMASILISFSYIMTRSHPGYLWLASLGFILNWFGDSLDGTVARVRKIERPRYGYFIDHVVDTVGIVIVFIGLGISPYVHMIVALAGAIAYLEASILVYLITNVTNVFELSFAKIGPTEIRLISIIVNVFLYFIGIRYIQLPFGDFTIFDFVILGLIILIFLMMAVKVYAVARDLARQEAVKKPSKH